MRLGLIGHRATQRRKRGGLGWPGPGLGASTLVDEQHRRRLGCRRRLTYGGNQSQAPVRQKPVTVGSGRGLERTNEGGVATPTVSQPPINLAVCASSADRG